MASLEAKKKQHYVMQNYLARWKSESTDKKNEGIWVFNKTNRRTYFCTNLNNIAQIGYFYEIYIDSDVLGLLNGRYLKYAECRPLLEQFDVLRRYDEIKKNLPIDEINVDLSIVNKNYLEDQYSKLENVLAKVIASINEDIYAHTIKIIQKKDSMDALVAIFMLQLHRTKLCRDAAHNEIQRLFIKEPNGTDRELSEEQKNNFIKASLLLDSIVTTIEFTKKSYSVELLVNRTNIKFITTDNPANIFNYENRGDLSTFVGYMPLTPSIGLIIRGHKVEGKNYFVRSISHAEALAINKRIQNNCTQVYLPKRPIVM
ncbi:DUF4238 domain-containing protein [Aeromonas veronii]|uniref:DUF4238 domain-containing protein n=1 Tax=Aeromonas veronii TaxID=654 RepID=UPI0011166307|nr:DUF4238 domain-containing protein [Aeromonas veronii]